MPNNYAKAIFYKEGGHDVTIRDDIREYLPNTTVYKVPLKPEEIEKGEAFVKDRVWQILQSHGIGYDGKATNK